MSSSDNKSGRQDLNTVAIRPTISTNSQGKAGWRHTTIGGRTHNDNTIPQACSTHRQLNKHKRHSSFLLFFSHTRIQAHFPEDQELYVFHPYLEKKDTFVFFQNQAHNVFTNILELQLIEGCSILTYIFLI